MIRFLEWKTCSGWPRERIPIKRRVHQGDSFGSLLFALGLEGAMTEGRTQAETAGIHLDLTAFLLDDGTVGSSHEATQASLVGSREDWMTEASN